MALISTSPDCNYRGDVMGITNELNQIKNAIYGKDVRGAIHDAIKECYDEASVNRDNANMEVKLARGTHNTLNERLDEAEQKLDQTNAQLSNVQRLKITEVNIENQSKKQLIDVYNSTVMNNTTNETLVVSTFNIKSFEHKKRANILKALNLIYKSCCNVCCIQEYLTSPNFNTDNIMLTKEFEDIYFRQSLMKNEGRYGLFMISNKELSNRGGGDYTMPVGTFEQRCYQRATYTFNDKKVSIYNTHLSYESNEIILGQLEQLKLVINNDKNPYKIICGDFNTESLSVFEPLIRDGFKYSNNGSFKTYKTTPKALDNIIVSGNIDIKKVEMLISEDEASDHNLLKVEMTLN